MVEIKAMRLHIPKYHSKDFLVMVGSMLPMAVVTNYFLFGREYFGSVALFLPATVVTFIFLSVAFITYGLVAVSLRERFPDDKDFLKRTLICLGVFYLMSAVWISVLLLSFDAFSFLGYQYSDAHFIHAWLSFMVINTFLTFLNEGIYRFERLRITVTENEQLKKEYLYSQLMGLKSQMNPHFLFNSLNTLSSLIHEDEEKAEDFLDHMSKVYRYLLRSNDEQLVSLQQELNNLESFCFLLKERYGDGLQLVVDADGSMREMQLPPLTLQLIVENAVNFNLVSRTHPLQIHISAGGQWLEVTNAVQPKINGAKDDAAMWVNIANKCRLLCNQDIIFYQNEGIRKIRMPLIDPPKTDCVC